MFIWIATCKQSNRFASSKVTQTFQTCLLTANTSLSLCTHTLRQNVHRSLNPLLISKLFNGLWALWSTCDSSKIKLIIPDISPLVWNHISVHWPLPTPRFCALTVALEKVTKLSSAFEFKEGINPSKRNHDSTNKIKIVIVIIKPSEMSKHAY